MVKFIAPSFIIASCLMHLFCCGIPLLLSVTSLATVFGLSSISALHIEWFEAVEREFLIASGVALLVALAAQVLSKRLNCHEEVQCCDAPCDSKKSFSNHLLWFACGLYSLNVLTLLFA